MSNGVIADFISVLVRPEMHYESLLGYALSLFTNQDERGPIKRVFVSTRKELYACAGQGLVFAFAK